LTNDFKYLTNFCQSFCNILEKYTKYIVVSGFFVIVSGRSRATEDIDIIIERFDLDTFLKLHSELVKNHFQCLQSSNPIEIHDLYLKENIPVRYIFNEQLIPNVELKFAKDKLDEFQIKTRVKIDFTEIDIYFSSIEANIAFKEELLKSPKDIDDAKHLRIVYSERIDERMIKKIKEMIKRYRL
jgi:ATP-dependent exoDNAse (exonuclease V) beta subunit